LIPPLVSTRIHCHFASESILGWGTWMKISEERILALAMVFDAYELDLAVFRKIDGLWDDPVGLMRLYLSALRRAVHLGRMDVVECLAWMFGLRD
jgi:hypothetical protein